MELGWTGPYLIVQKISDVTYTIQKSPQSVKINVHIDHLKPYLGENSPRPWVDPEGNPIDCNQTEILTEPENQNDSSQRWSPDLSENMQDLFYPDDEDVIEYEEPESLSVHIPPPLVRSPIRTRAGRAVRPRDIYSP